MWKTWGALSLWRDDREGPQQQQQQSEAEDGSPASSGSRSPSSSPRLASPGAAARAEARPRKGKSTRAGGSSGRVADVASPARRRERRKTQPPSAVGVRFPELAGGDDASAERFPGQLATQFLMLDRRIDSEPLDREAPEPFLLRRQRRCKTWADQREKERPQPKEPPAEHAGAGCKLFVAEASPAQKPLAGPGQPGASVATLSTAACSSAGADSPARLSPGSLAGEGRGRGWKLGRQVGSGAFGRVYRVFDPETGLVMAAKKALFDEGSEEDRKYRDTLRNELETYKELRHPNIVSFLGYECADTHVLIYLEYVSEGSLASFLREFGPVEGDLFRRGARGLVEGLCYLHSRSPPVVHRDIKAANVLVGEGFCLKLADFGCSKCDTDTKSFTVVGSIPWMAPEVIQQQDGFGRKADVWSLGCTLIEMATAENPWGPGTLCNMMFALKHIGLTDTTPPIPEGLPAGGSDFIASCVRRSVRDRPSSRQLLQHEFVRDALGGESGAA